MEEYPINKMTLHNKISENTYIHDTKNKKILMKTTYNTETLANFCIKSITWNESSKDIQKITLSSRTEKDVTYDLSTNATAITNRIIKDVTPSPYNNILTSQVPKRYMRLGMNSYLYEFIWLIIQKITNNKIEATTKEEKI